MLSQSGRNFQITRRDVVQPFWKAIPPHLAKLIEKRDALICVLPDLRTARSALGFLGVWANNSNECRNKDCCLSSHFVPPIQNTSRHSGHLAGRTIVLDS